jgi:hypothetical protein
MNKTLTKLMRKAKAKAKLIEKKSAEIGSSTPIPT